MKISRYLLVAILSCGLGLLSGCITCGNKAVSVGQMQPCWHANCRAKLRPVDLSLLKRPALQQHVVMARDVIGVHVEGVVSGAEVSSGERELPRFDFAPTLAQQGIVESPAIGQPFEVRSDGAVDLPIIGAIPVAGKTLQQVADEIRVAYVKQGALKEDPSRSYVQIALIRPRVNRVLVIREDAPVTSPAISRRDTNVIAKRGSGDVLELRDEHSDLLTALVETGGLPGEDARSNVWILRGGADWDQATSQFYGGCSPEEISSSGQHTVVPLRYCCNKPLPFSRQDVVLNDGDIVFVEKRHEEYFYTGGLLSAGQIPLPRDEDIDILEAIALANIGVGGPAGVNASASQFRSGPGNVIPPTRAIVLRKLPQGDQLKIEVDLRKAVNDAEERIVIMPEDFIMLHYRAHELVGNIALNFVNVSYIIPNN